MVKTMARRRRRSHLSVERGSAISSSHRGRGRPPSELQTSAHRIDAGDIDAGETLAHRIEGEADPDGAPGLIAGADPRRNGDDYPMTSLSDGLGPQKDPNSGRTRVDPLLVPVYWI